MNREYQNRNENYFENENQNKAEIIMLDGFISMTEEKINEPEE